MFHRAICDIVDIYKKDNAVYLNMLIILLFIYNILIEFAFKVVFFGPVYYGQST